MVKIAKTKFIKVRVEDEVKKEFASKIAKSGFTQSDFLNACIMNYLGIETSSVYRDVLRKEKKRVSQKTENYGSEESS